MAVLVKKTYSKRQEGVSSLSVSEKENFDPFDELLSSPLKQDVQFKPLSFWGEKDLEFKNRLSETIDTDDNSPCRKKKQLRKYLKPQNQTLSKQSKSYVNQNIFSSTRSLNKKNYFSTAFKDVGNTTFHPFRNDKSKSLDYLHGLKRSRNKKNFYNKTSSKFVDIQKENNNESNCNPIVECFRSEENSLIKQHKVSLQSSLEFKIHEDVDQEKEINNKWDESILCANNSQPKNLTACSNEILNETLMPFHEDRNSYKFVNIKRHYNNLEEKENYNRSLVFDSSEGSEHTNTFQSHLKENENSDILSFGISKDITLGQNLGYSKNNMLVCNETVHFNESTDESLSNLSHIDFTKKTDGDRISDDTYNVSKNDSLALSEDTESVHLLEFETENTYWMIGLDNSQIVHANTSKIKEFIEELLSESKGNSNSCERESNFTSDESTSYVTDEDSVIKVPVKSSEHSDTNASNRESEPVALCTSDLEEEIDVAQFDSPSKEVLNLAADISNLTISNADESVGVSLEHPAETVQYFSNRTKPKDAKRNSVLIDLRNVTKRKKYRSIGNVDEKDVDERSRMSSSEERVQSKSDREKDPEREEEEEEEDPEHSTLAETTVFDWSKTIVFATPMFESTRVLDASGSDLAGKGRAEEEKRSEDSRRSWTDHSFALKPGKKWLRSVSVLKQIRNGNVSTGRCESSRVKGRKYESFVKDMLEMQNGKSGWSSSLADLSQFKKRLTGSGFKKLFSPSVGTSSSDLESDTSLKEETVKSSFFSSRSDQTVLEASFINPTIKVISSENSTNKFGLKGTDLLLQGVPKDSVKDESSSTSGRDFILLQCGQEDILPFEEYFNEKTLKNCKKIGEGVYGEVFMSSDAVIKIIPIEGSEKVNGEPQKTFEEILSEVVIALKLSQLRNGKGNQTDGFAEVKRCWCVRGKYPEYLQRLWDEYDQMGSGSENDSPVMFKDDQLYIILELANGGKDLESFVFSSACQSLSVFIQTAFSLAAAEKALEFEHRDLHWGNVLITQTKEKFVTVTLENVEYKIPSKGVKVCIIDFTLSRICHESFCIFNDLSVDPSLFASEGDYQFEIYRMMLAEVRNDWSLFRPKTNIFWLHYTLDKMIHMVRYKNRKTKVHKKAEKELKILESLILDFNDTAEFATSDPLSAVVKRL